MNRAGLKRGELLNHINNTRFKINEDSGETRKFLLVIYSIPEGKSGKSEKFGTSAVGGCVGAYAKKPQQIFNELPKEKL